MARRRKPKSKFPATPLKPELEISSVQDIEWGKTNAPDSAAVPESVTSYERGTSALTPEDEEDEYKSPVTLQFQKRKGIYYSVTKAEINIYAQLGWISTFCLTLFGAFIGLAFGCFVALMQENIPYAAQALLKSLKWVTGLVSLIFLIFAILLMVLQMKNKKAWESSE